jgi:N-acetylmuramoyl-L-alanine amidase
MLRGVIVTIVIYLSLFSLSFRADGSIAEVSLRFSDHEGYTRIVFEAGSDAFIENTSVTTSGDVITIQFPSNFIMRMPGNFAYRTSMKGTNFTISIPYSFRIKVMKLSSPPRVAFDILKTETGEPEREPAGASQGSEQKTRALPIPPLPSISVVLDPGHGGYDLGIVSEDVREKDSTLLLAKLIETDLMKKGKPVFLTRRSDQFLSISERAVFANQKSPDAFISLHLSISEQFVIYVPFTEPANQEMSIREFYGTLSRQKRFVEKSKALGKIVGKYLLESFKTEVVQQEMALPLLRSVGAASVMIEVPPSTVYDHTARAKLSEVIVKAISSYGSR